MATKNRLQVEEELAKKFKVRFITTDHIPISISGTVVPQNIWNALVEAILELEVLNATR